MSTSNNGGPTVAVKLYIDKEKKKVLFAESDKEFVDVLFSFLTLPLGTIVRLLGKQSQIGCLDELYKSVEALSEDYFQTKACKAMLLRPRNAAGSHCDRLKVKVDDTNERLIYVCPTSSCDARSFSSFWGVCNSCTVTTTLILRETPVDCRTVESNDDGVFVKSDLKFIIFDDLHVAAASTSTMFPLLGKFGLLEQRNIEEKVLELNSHKIINLLKRALVSKQSLTGLLCDHPVETDSVNLDHLREKLFPKQENTTDPKFNAVRITIVQTKDDSSVLYAEVGYDFVDLVFGLLSLPLGSTIKAYGQVTSGGSSGLDNLYRSINGSGIGCVKQECQSLLLSPMLAPFFGCGSSVLLQVQESPIKSCSLRVIRAAKIPNEMLVKKELTLDRTQVLKLLRPALVTRNALSSQQKHSFLPAPPTQRTRFTSSSSSSTTTTMAETKIEGPTIAVKLFVDKERSRVLFAESDKDFVDVLFGFLTLPLGTVVRLLGRQSQVGCLDELYKSVEDLSADYFHTKACKAMLLKPHNTAAEQCCLLKVKVDDTDQSAVYVCRDANCSANGDCGVTSVAGSVCKCGKVMEYIGEWPQDGGSTAAAGSDGGVFVKGCYKFIVTDDLHVAPASTSLMMSIFDKYGVRDPANLEQKILHLNAEKITCLLKRSLTSKQTLTGYYFDVPNPNDEANLYVLPESLYSEQDAEVDHKLNNMKIKVLQRKNNTSLLYAEVGEDFVDLLFGLLSIPLGSILKTYGKWSSNGCVDNIYMSIDGSAKGCMNPERQMLLVSPNVASFFGCSATNMLIQLGEAAPKQRNISGCFKCFKIAGFSCYGHCSDQIWNTGKKAYVYKNCLGTTKTCKLCEINPKVPSGGSHKGEGYVKPGVQKFMVTDDLHILPLSLTSTLQVVSESKVMELIRAVLVTRNTLSSVLLPPKKKKRLHLQSSLY
uniref:DUF674 domain-containing protein n=1 Tax=Oryza barthii TaxID=65489 RepID=A0A0D3FZM3_9ORYZ